MADSCGFREDSKSCVLIVVASETISVVIWSDAKDDRGNSLSEGCTGEVYHTLLKSGLSDDSSGNREAGCVSNDETTSNSEVKAALPLFSSVALVHGAPGNPGEQLLSGGDGEGLTCREDDVTPSFPK